MSFEYLQWGNVDEPGKIVILLHGYARDGRIMVKQAQEIMALMPESLIIAPHGGEECVDYSSRRQWFNIRVAGNAVYHGLRQAALDMNGFIDDLCRQYNLTDKDIAVMGFSQGASLALYTGFTRTHDLGCVVAHSIFFREDMNLSKRDFSVLYLYGTQDEEFDPPVFWQGRDNLSALADDISVYVVKDLAHKTSAYSRQITARYIRDKF